MFGLKKRRVTTPSIATVAKAVPDALVRRVDVEWDHASLILTVSDSETGALVAASSGAEVVKAADVTVVRRLHVTTPQSEESLTAAMAAVAMVGIRVIDARHPGQRPIFLG